MKVAVVGAGALGGFIAARLATAGLPAPLVARRRTLDILQRDGLIVEGPSSMPVTVRPHVTDDTLALGAQDAVVLAVPAPALPEILELLPPLLGRATRLVPVVGGVPWWYPAEGPLASVDPHGLLWNAMPAKRIVGAVAQVAVERPAPGYLRHLGGLRLALGSAAGTAEVGDLVALFGAAGFNAAPVDDIRAEVWAALPAPLAFGALAIVTGLPVQEIARDIRLQPVVAAVVDEVAGLAAQLGHPMADGMEDALAFAGQPGQVRPDLATARRAEIEAVLDAPLELAACAGVTLPTVSALRALVRVKIQR